MADRPHPEPTRVCIKGSGFSSATGGFTALTIDGKRYSANDVGAAIAAWNTRTQANETMQEALERIAATDFDSPPWQAVEAEIKQIALSALSGDSA